MSSRTCVSMERSAGSPTLRQALERAGRAMHDVADAVDVEDDEILAEGIHHALELADHRLGPCRGEGLCAESAGAERLPTGPQRRTPPAARSSRSADPTRLVLPAPPPPVTSRSGMAPAPQPGARDPAVNEPVTIAEYGLEDIRRDGRPSSTDHDGRRTRRSILERRPGSSRHLRHGRPLSRLCCRNHAATGLDAARFGGLRGLLRRSFPQPRRAHRHGDVRHFGGAEPRLGPGHRT